MGANAVSNNSFVGNYYNDYSNVKLLQLREKYKTQYVGTETYTPEVGGGSTYISPAAKNDTGLSSLVTNAKQNEKGSYDITQNVNSGYGRMGISRHTFVA